MKTSKDDERAEKVTVRNNIFYYLFIWSVLQLCVAFTQVFLLVSSKTVSHNISSISVTVLCASMLQSDRHFCSIKLKETISKKTATPAYVGVKNIYLYIHLYLLYLASLRWSWIFNRYVLTCVCLLYSRLGLLA